MDVRIQSIHFDASEQLQAFIQKKVSKLEKYYEDIKKVVKQSRSRAEAEQISVLSFRKWKSCGNSTYSET